MIASATASRAWIAAENDPDQSSRLAASLGVPTAVATLLRQRGIVDESVAEEFLNPSLLQLHPPEVIADLDRAVAKIAETAAAGKTICIYGDYDVDGVTGTAILVEACRELGIETRTYIPHRLEEGYGLNRGAVRSLAEEGVGLLVTVDGGANDREELALAAELGLPVIVTDHHPIEGELAPIPVVHPGRADSPSPSATLCGAGVAYKLAWGLGKHFAGEEKVSPRFRNFLEEALALVALGTVADVVPLQGENRALVAFGLRSLARTPRPGIEALCEVCGIDRRRMTATDIGFRLGPHINAAGRMGEVDKALELLLTRDRDRARELAKELAKLNRRRKEIEQKMLDECLEEWEDRAESPPNRAVLFAREGWHSGVAGIVAARMVDRLSRPVFVISLEEEIGRGSARSLPELPLTDVYDRVRREALSIGGHACAGGVTVSREGLAAFQGALSEAPVGEPSGEIPPRLYDLELDSTCFDLEFVRQMAALAPFGAGNPEPVFRVSGLSLPRPPRLVGRREEHLMLDLRRDGRTLSAIWFGGGEWAGEVIRRDAENRNSLSFIVALSEDHYRGVARLRARIIDLCSE